MTLRLVSSSYNPLELEVAEARLHASCLARRRLLQRVVCKPSCIEFSKHFSSSTSSLVNMSMLCLKNVKRIWNNSLFKAQGEKLAGRRDLRIEPQFPLWADNVPNQRHALNTGRPPVGSFGSVLIMLPDISPLRRINPRAKSNIVNKTTRISASPQMRPIHAAAKPIEVRNAGRSVMDDGINRRIESPTRCKPLHAASTSQVRRP